MGIRERLREKMDDFQRSRTSSVAERLASLKQERVKEEGRARIYRLEKEERLKLDKAKSERRELVNEKRFAGVKKIQAGLKKIQSGAKKYGDDNKNNPWR